ncbi:MAG: hypothetical protein ABW221_04340 [Vicinamibacteria bacterium]
MMRARKMGVLGALVPIGAIALWGCSTPGADRSPGQTPIVRQVDHVLVASRQARELFALLSETFRLPVAWPLSDFGGFSSGGVGMGNAILEVVQDSGATDGARFIGFALEPGPLRTSLGELAARRIPHGRPAPFRSRDPGAWMKTLGTTVGLPDVSSGTAEVFLCAYASDRLERTGRLREDLRSRGGGPLTVHSIREVVYGARDVDLMQERWQALLFPLQPSSPGVWSLGSGPAIRVARTERDGALGLVIEVRSLAQARPLLAAHGALLKGLDIALVEGP